MNSYFSHDSNARNDEKLIALRLRYGWEGYGVYWAIIEKLRDANNYQLSTDYRIIAFDLRVEIEVIRSIICDFKLFEIEEDYFYAETLRSRMLIKDTKSEKSRLAANQRWENEKNTEPKKSTEFTPPSVTEVAAYCQQRKNKIDANKFIDFYESRGWMVGRTPMKSWQAALRIWERNENNNHLENNEPRDATNRLHPALQ